MKKLLGITVVFLIVLVITALNIDPVSTHSLLKASGLNIVPVSNQPLQIVGAGGKPISDDVIKIAKKSCMNCHSEPGNGMALAHVNLSNWDKYSPEKQAAKAKAMCNMVTKGKMPPKKFREGHPDGVPSKDEIKTICDWAQ